MEIGILEKVRLDGWTDEEVIDRIRGGETAFYEIIMRGYNQRLYRVARDSPRRPRGRGRNARMFTSERTSTSTNLPRERPFPHG